LSIAIAMAAAIAGSPLGQTVTPYPTSFFTASQPNSALDMVALLPGFTFDAGGQARGLASSGGNVLIDGARPASKDDSLDDVLRRIPASSVERIDLIRGGAPGIDMQGRTIIANVVRRKDLGGTLTITATGTHGLDSRRSGLFLIDGERHFGATRVEVSFLAAKFLDDTTGQGDWVRVNPAGRTLFAARETNFGGADDYKGTLAVDSRVFGGKLTLNASANLNPYNERTIDTLPGSTGAEVDHFKQETDSVELGGRYEHAIGQRWSSETYVLQRFGRDLNPDDFQSTPQAVALTGDDLSDVFRLNETTSESILRETVTYRAGPSLTVKAGVEGDDNVLTSRTSFVQNGAPVTLPAADVTVSELRGEAFATATWQARPNLTVEAGFREEASRISSTGDVITARNLYYPKPRVVVTWTPDTADQFRLRAEREIGQLDFNVFVASTAGINTGTVLVGNPTLDPNQDWAFEVDWDRHFWNGAVLTLSFQRQIYDQLVDRIGVNSSSGEYDSPGDIGAADVNTEAVNLNLPTDRLGLPHGTLTGVVTFRQSHVIDPTTGPPRAFSTLHPSDWEIHFNQGFPGLKASWGFDVQGPFVQSAYRFNEVDQLKSNAYLDAFVEYKPRPDFTIQVQALNLTSRRAEQSRQVFNGPRRPGGVAFADIHNDSAGPLIKLKVIKTFQ